MAVTNYNDDFYVITDVLSPEECSAYTKYFFENSDKDLMTHRENMLFFQLGELDLDNPESEFNADLVGNRTRLANIVRDCRQFFIENYTLDAPIEFKRTFIHTMQKGTEIESHDDDGDIYEGKPEGERHYSAVLVFNDDYEGGEFHFETLGWSSKLPAGSMVVFRGDLRRLHGVKPVESGYRVSMPIFFRTVGTAE